MKKEKKEKNENDVAVGLCLWGKRKGEREQTRRSKRTWEGAIQILMKVLVRTSQGRKGGRGKRLEGAG